MKKNSAELIFILDRSGSMAGLEGDTIGGYNSMVEQQKGEPGEAFVTTVLFDTQYEKLYDHTPLNDVKPLTRNEYYARGCTALLDAVGQTIDSVGERLADTPEDERPDRVIFVITTDGHENASRKYSLDDVRKKIEHQQSVYSWKFVFLGANIDAVSEAGSLGIDQRYAREYTNSARGVETVYTAMSASLTAMRASDMPEEEVAKAVTDALNSVE